MGTYSVKTARKIFNLVEPVGKNFGFFISMERAINRNFVKVATQPVSLGDAVCKNSPMEDPIWTKGDARDQISRVKGDLFDLLGKIGGVLVEGHCADGDEGKFLLGPDFGWVEGVKGACRGGGWGHYLDI